MDPIVIKEYSSEQYFLLYEAQVYTEFCADMVVFRALGGMFAGPSVDLIFIGLHYFELPSRLISFRVWRPRDEQALEFAKVLGAKGSAAFADRVFAVESKGKRFDVIAAKCWVLEYAKPQRVSAVSALNDLANRDAYLERDVKAWYKVE